MAFMRAMAPSSSLMVSHLPSAAASAGSVSIAAPSAWVPSSRVLLPELSSTNATSSSTSLQPLHQAFKSGVLLSDLFLRQNGPLESRARFFVTLPSRTRDLQQPSLFASSSCDAHRHLENADAEREVSRLAMASHAERLPRASASVHPISEASEESGNVIPEEGRKTRAQLEQEVQTLRQEVEKLRQMTSETKLSRKQKKAVSQQLRAREAEKLTREAEKQRLASLEQVDRLKRSMQISADAVEKATAALQLARRGALEQPTSLLGVAKLLQVIFEDDAAVVPPILEGVASFEGIAQECASAERWLSYTAAMLRGQGRADGDASPLMAESSTAASLARHFRLALARCFSSSSEMELERIERALFGAIELLQDHPEIRGSSDLINQAISNLFDPTRGSLEVRGFLHELIRIASFLREGRRIEEVSMIVPYVEVRGWVVNRKEERIVRREISSKQEVDAYGNGTYYEMKLFPKSGYVARIFKALLLQDEHAANACDELDSSARMEVLRHAVKLANQFLRYRKILKLKPERRLELHVTSRSTIDLSVIRAIQTFFLPFCVSITWYPEMTSDEGVIMMPRSDMASQVEPSPSTQSPEESKRRSFMPPLGKRELLPRP